jgi:hypothetical protein
MRKLPRELWWIAGLTICLAVIAGLLGAGEQMRSEKVRFVPTTYTTSQFGVRGLYLTLEALRYDVRRYRRPFGGELPSKGVILIIEPMLPILPTEWRALQRWVSAGHTLLLVGEAALPYTESGSAGSYPPRKTEESRDEPFPDLSFEEVPVAYASPTQPTHLSQGVTRLALKHATHIVVPEPDEERDKKHRQHEEELLEHLQERSRANELAEALRVAAPTFADDEGAVVASARVGRGRVVLFGSPWSLTNAGLSQADNLVFALNAIGPVAAGPVYFDEYHHGFGEQLAWGLLPLPAKVATVQFLLAFLVLAYARSRRFGRVLPLQRGPRERSEFLGAMATLLRKGEATRLALRTAYDAAKQRIRRQLGLPPEAESEDLVLAAARLDPKHGERLGAALERCRAALESQGEVSESRAMALIRELDDAERLLRQI